MVCNVARIVRMMYCTHKVVIGERKTYTLYTIIKYPHYITSDLQMNFHWLEYWNTEVLSNGTKDTGPPSSSKMSAIDIDWE